MLWSARYGSDASGNFDSRAEVPASFCLSRRFSLVRRPVLFLSFVEPLNERDQGN